MKCISNSFCHLHLSLFDTLCHGSPDISLVFSQRLFGLNFGKSSDCVLLGLVAHVRGQRDDRVHHVVPVLAQPRDGVDVPTVVQRHLDVFCRVAGLFSILVKKMLKKKLSFQILQTISRYFEKFLSAVKMQKWNNGFCIFWSLRMIVLHLLKGCKRAFLIFCKHLREF